MRVSLGCGAKQMIGYVGLDKENFGWNKIWDAEKDNIPLEDSSAEWIEMHNFLEHIERKYWRRLFNECWRVLKPQGSLEIITPDAGVDIQLALADPTHVSFVVKGTFTQYLTGARPRNADYGFKKWLITKCDNSVPNEHRDIYCLMQPNK